MAIKISSGSSKNFKRPLTQDNVTSFIDFLKNNGLELAEPLNEHGRGKCYSEAGGRDRRLKGWYYFFLHQEYPFGACFDWRAGDAPLAQWTANQKGEISPEEQQKAAQAVIEARREYEKELAKQHKEAQQEVLKIWQSSPECTDHPYLTNKNVISHGLRVSEGPDYEGYLLIPYRDETKQIVTLSYIPPDGGQKWWHKGAKRKGTWAVIGANLLQQAPTRINYVEGYATGASWFDYVQQQEPVIITGDANGMKEVPKTFHKWFPTVTHVFLADNDESNTGQEAAEVAANWIKQQNGKAEIKLPEEQGLDFNDAVNQLEGELIVKEVPMDTQEVDFARNKPGGRIMATTENYRTLFEQSNIDIRYNVISKEMEIQIPDMEFIHDLSEEAQLAELENRCIQAFVPEGRMLKNIPLLAREYNPVKEWIESKPWDGVSRIQDLLDTITAEDEKLKNILMSKWLMGCAAVGCQERGANLEGVLIFQGKQAIGKTSWIKSLLPNNEWFLEGATLDPSDKDSVRSVLSHFIVELGELGSTFKRDIDKLKAFLTKAKDELRLPYGRAFSRYVRRTAFFGSVNEREFLVDSTGNRRFWTVRVHKINFKHNIDMQQCWAEIWQKAQGGNSNWFLTSEERDMLQNSNEMSRTTTAVEELVLQQVRFDSKLTQPVQMVQLLKDLGIANPRVTDFKEAARVLHEKGYKPRKSNGKKLYDLDYKPINDDDFKSRTWNET